MHTQLHPESMMTPPAMFPATAIRVVGDVHGDATAFAYAAATDRFVLQLGDLVDHGPDSAGVLRIMFRLIDQGRGLFLLGNHDLKLARCIAGQPVRSGPELQATLAQLDAPLRQRLVTEVARAPAWLRRGNALFVHGGFHTAMLDQPAPDHALERPRGPLARRCTASPPAASSRTAIPSAACAGWTASRPA